MESTPTPKTRIFTRRNVLLVLLGVLVVSWVNITRPEALFGAHITPSDEPRIRWERIYTLDDLEAESLRLARLAGSAEALSAMLEAAGERPIASRSGGRREFSAFVTVGYGRARFISKWEIFTIRFQFMLSLAQGFGVDIYFDVDGAVHSAVASPTYLDTRKNLAFVSSL